MTTQIHNLLKTHFGFDSFRPLQEDIIQTVLNKQDVITLMPTGGGKSLCYQLPGLAIEGMTLVISPLIALMKDQVDALKANGIAAESLTSRKRPEEIQAICAKARRGELRFLYIAPERLANGYFRDFLLELNVKFIVVDEAHCISEWGHDFRPDYRNLKMLRKDFPRANWMALTATATKHVLNDITQQLSLEQAKTFTASFNRENLTYHVLQKTESFSVLMEYLEKHKDESAIIYCFSRKQTEELSMDLRAEGVKARPYHAGLDHETRRQTQEDFIHDKTNVIVATIAFGMGVDKPDIRLVVHYSMPKSIEGYYQETGRAGRDGEASECVLFYSPGDVRKQYFFINQMQDIQEKENATQKVEDMKLYCELKSCKRKYLLEYFGGSWPQQNCQSCNSCLGGVEAKKKPDIEFNQDLFEILRLLRKQLADKENVPAYTVFADRSLMEMAAYYPQSETKFYMITGVGRRKLDQYGQTFLAAIKSYCVQNGLEEKEVPSRSARRERAPKKRLVQREDSTYQETKRLIEQQRTIEDVANIRAKSQGTILGHIEKLIQAGEQVAIDHLRPSRDRFDRIEQAFRESGGTALKPVFVALGEEISYEELRLARLFMGL